MLLGLAIGSRIVLRSLRVTPWWKGTTGGKGGGAIFSCHVLRNSLPFDRVMCGYMDVN